MRAGKGVLHSCDEKHYLTILLVFGGPPLKNILHYILTCNLEGADQLIIPFSHFKKLMKAYYGHEKPHVI